MSSSCLCPIACRAVRALSLPSSQPHFAAWSYDGPPQQEGGARGRPAHRNELRVLRSVLCALDLLCPLLSLLLLCFALLCFCFALLSFALPLLLQSHRQWRRRAVQIATKRRQVAQRVSRQKEAREQKQVKAISTAAGGCGRSKGARWRKSPPSVSRRWAGSRGDFGIAHHATPTPSTKRAQPY